MLAGAGTCAGRRSVSGARHRLDLGDRFPRVARSSELQQLVLQPRQRVVVPHRAPELLALDPPRRRVERRSIRGRGLAPQPELQKDVRRHVQRVARRVRLRGVGARGVERERRVLGVVVGVQQVVQRLGVLRVFRQHPFEDRRDLRLDRASRQLLTARRARLAEADQAARHVAEERQRIQRRDIRIVGQHPKQVGHRGGVARVTRRAIAVSEQLFNGAEQAALARRAGCRGARRWTRPETGQRGAGGVDVLAAPQRLMIGERFPPVGEYRLWIERFRRAKRLVRVLVLELMQGGDAVRDARLRIGALRPGERGGGEREHQAKDERAHRGSVRRWGG